MTHIRAISLGKLLVQELGLEPRTDTLSRWMAHYIGEQISNAESATGKKKSRAEERCFDAVLKLWKHRWSLPSGRRPFENFEPVMHALERLDPDNPRSFYLPPHTEEEICSPQADAVKEWLEIAFEIDHTARILINFAVEQASHDAVNKKTLSWLKSATNVVKDKDISVVIRLISAAELLDDNDVERREELRQHQENDLKSKIERLDTFTQFSKSLRSALKDELGKIRTRKAKSKRK